MLDRELQRDILRKLSSSYPNFSRLRDDAGGKSSEHTEIFNLYYLRGHGLVDIKTEVTDRVPPARITSEGLDFLEADGGLGAILGVVTVRLHDDTLRALLIKQVRESDEPEGVKEQLAAVIKGLPAKALETASLNLVSFQGVKGLLHLLTGMAG